MFVAAPTSCLAKPWEVTQDLWSSEQQCILSKILYVAGACLLALIALPLKGIDCLINCNSQKESTPLSPINPAERQALIQGWKQKAHEYHGGTETFTNMIIGWLADSRLNPNKCTYDHVLFFPIREHVSNRLLPADGHAPRFVNLAGKKLIVLVHFPDQPLPLTQEQIKNYNRTQVIENRNVEEKDRDNFHFVSLRFPKDRIPADLIPILNP